MSLKVPSSEVCDRIAVVTEEGLELEARLLTFAREATEAAQAFDAEVEPLDLDGQELDRAAVRSGLGVVHALTERMMEALVGVVGGSEVEEVAA
jgi:hypothetical protein